MDWVGIIGYSVSILLIAAILGVMLLLVRILSGDSEQFKDLKEMVDTLFNTPAHLRPGSGSGPGETDPARSAAASSTEADASPRAPFEEPCPACGETVTERHRVCPSCELRLQ